MVQGVGVPNADFYTKYLEVPAKAKSGTWDMSLAGWSPDWYGDAAKSFFEPLFDGRILPPTSSTSRACTLPQGSRTAAMRPLLIAMSAATPSFSGSTTVPPRTTRSNAIRPILLL